MKQFNANHVDIIRIGTWTEQEGCLVCGANFAKLLIMFRGNEIRISAEGKFACSLDGGDKIENNVIETENGIHTLLLTAMTGCEIREIEVEELISVDAYLRKQMAEEYEHIQKGRKASDPAQWQKVAYGAAMPTEGVLLKGTFGELFDRNIERIKRCFKEPDYVEDPQPEPGKRRGWSDWLPAANDGRILGGAAKALRWREDVQLRQIVDEIVDRSKANMRSDGYFNYYTEADSYAHNHIPNVENSMETILNSERKNYDRVFWTMGMLAADRAGNKDALSLARRMNDWLENSGWGVNMLLGHNGTNAFMGTLVMADSPAGKTEDMLFNQKYLDQHYWEAEFLRRNPVAFSNYPGDRPHCYGLLELLALAYEYRLTGDRHYLDVLLAGWEVYKNHYKHVGGITTMCERDGPYMPGSYQLDIGHNGETCGSVFWIWINEQLQQLFPENTAYAEEIEEAMLNVVPSILSAEGRTRYHNKLQGKKDPGERIGSCCELMSTFLFSDLPKYVYMQNGEGLWVNQYISSAITGERLSLIMDADITEKNRIDLTVTKAPTESYSIKLRIPQWAKDAKIYINDVYTASGACGTYETLQRVWTTGDRMTVTFVPEIRTVCYTGVEQPEDGQKRYALFYGPYLMALVDVPEGSIPHLDILADSLDLEKREDGVLTINENIKFVPYWMIQDDTTFNCFPAYLD